MKPEKWRKRPVEILAMQYTEKSRADVFAWCGDKIKYHVWGDSDPDSLFITTLEGEHRLDLGYWVVQGVAGEFYGVRDDIFRRTYELVEGAK